MTQETGGPSPDPLDDLRRHYRALLSDPPGQALHLTVMTPPTKY
ncbi:MAG TPA: hypothetical protein VHV83_19100 [Armatimonadota bacterium]|nr:hypothetical protein [Armatimonadota bacterium]